MEFDTQTAAQYAGEKLDSLLSRATRDSAAVIAENDIPIAVAYFANLRDTVKDLASKVSELQKHVDSLSYELLPTMFQNQDVKTIMVKNVGRVTVNVRWNAKMLDRERGMAWLRSTGNEGLIIETVNAATLGAFAKEQSIAGAPLPSDTFQVGTAPYISITKS